MKGESTEDVVHWAVEPLPPGPATARERLLKATPAALMRLNAPLFRMRAGAGLRRAAITQAVQVGFALYERREYEAVTGFYAEDAVYDTSGMGEQRPLDVGVEYRGHAGIVAVLSELKDLDIRQVPSEIADPGGPLFAARVAHVLHGGGPSAGLEMAFDTGHVYSVRNGLIVRQHTYVGWDNTLAALDDARVGKPPWGGDPARPPRG
jgi:ketosteroid isomerase-like protein